MPIVWNPLGNQEVGTSGDLKSAGAVFVEGVAQGIAGNTLGLAWHAAQNVGAEAEGKPLSPEEWEDSPYYRDGMKFHEGWTAARWEIEAERHDTQVRRQYEEGQHPTAAVAGNVVGSLLDPVMAIPGLDVAEGGAKLFEGTRLAETVGKALEMPRAAKAVDAAVTAGGAEGAFQAANMAYQMSEGRNPDWKSALLHTAAIAAFGGVGGAFLGNFGEKARAVNRTVDQIEADAPTTPLEGIEDKVGISPTVSEPLEVQAAAAHEEEDEPSAFDKEMDQNVKEHTRGLRLGAKCLGLS